MHTHRMNTNILQTHSCICTYKHFHAYIHHHYHHIFIVIISIIAIILIIITTVLFCIFLCFEYRQSIYVKICCKQNAYILILILQGGSSTFTKYVPTSSLNLAIHVKNRIWCNSINSLYTCCYWASDGIGTGCSFLLLLIMGQSKGFVDGHSDCRRMGSLDGWVRIPGSPHAHAFIGFDSVRAHNELINIYRDQVW